jgi:hypothetical protein
MVPNTIYQKNIRIIFQELVVKVPLVLPNPPDGIFIGGFQVLSGRKKRFTL